ncbi:MAG: hypothetical protein ACOVOV_04870 [Dolichospermum sp.]|jgi:hypothetical protein
MTTYNWTITNLYTKTVEGLQDYVVTAMYNVEGVDVEFSSTVNGSQMFTVKEGQDFIPYSELTNEIVVEWIKEELGENGILSITACIDGQIESQKNPPVVPVITPLPWA